MPFNTEKSIITIIRSICTTEARSNFPSAVGCVGIHAFRTPYSATNFTLIYCISNFFIATTWTTRVACHKSVIPFYLKDNLTYTAFTSDFKIALIIKIRRISGNDGYRYHIHLVPQQITCPMIADISLSHPPVCWRKMSPHQRPATRQGALWE